jgi:hypothetical protein
VSSKLPQQGGLLSVGVMRGKLVWPLCWNLNFFGGGGAALEFELRASCLLVRQLCQPFFVLAIFEIGSQELFAWGCFKL